MSNESFSENFDRPIECSGCQNPIGTYYTQVVDESIKKHCMCNECPILQEKLFHASKETASLTSAQPSKLCCGRCGMTLEDIFQSRRLGCAECYSVFEDVLIKELVKDQIIPKEMANAPTFHTGSSPGENVELGSSVQLLALNEALIDMVEKEEYEQAARIRDQINELMEKLDEPGS